MIKHTTYNSFKEGPHLVVLGAVHGNEPAGTQAIQKFAQEIDEGKATISKGKVTFVPICNPLAYEQKKRFVERNLNRSLYPKQTYTAYEDQIDPILCAILDQADFLLDIHSYHTKGGAFAFLGTSNDTEIDFAVATGLEHYIYGWSEAFGSSGQNYYESMGTTEYTRYTGELPALKEGEPAPVKSKKGVGMTLECGQHDNPDNAQIAYKAITNVVSYLGLDRSEDASTDLSNFSHPDVSYIQMKQVFIKEKSGELIKDWRHCDQVQKGDLIAKYDDGEELLAPDDGLIILPFAASNHEKREEWFYFGVKTDRPAAKD